MALLVVNEQSRLEFANLVSRAFRGDRKAREELTRKFMKMADSSAVMFARKAGLPPDDLVGSARAGLAQAIAGFRFDGQNAGAFPAYAKICIRNELIRFLAVEQRWRGRGLRPVSLEDFCERNGLEVDDLAGPTEVTDVFEDSETRQLVHRLLGDLAKLPRGKRWARTLREAFGIGRPALSRKEIAQRAGCCPWNVTLMVRTAVKNLRKLLEER